MDAASPVPSDATEIDEAGAPEIVVTEAMADAGVLALYAYENAEAFCTPEERVRRVFAAMLIARSAEEDDRLSIHLLQGA